MPEPVVELTLEQQKDLVELLFDEAQALKAWAMTRLITPEERVALRTAMADRARELEQRGNALRNQLQTNPQGGTK